MGRRVRLAVLAMVMLPGLVACGGSTTGTPSGSSTSAEVKLFDPCAGIPDDALTAAGVDPATEESGIAGVHQHGQEICAWKGRAYAITIYSTGRTVGEYERKPGNVEFEDVVIAGRTGRQFRDQGTSHDRLCNVLFPATQGVFQITVHSSLILDNPPPPCPTLHEVGEVLVPKLPS
ncbi:DUF3558 domain-containing protein [Nocardia callitridis]|uniref:DUF3558 domain-containing protein n=1 Tax=Nocardia callitridis TaxID=648753 RepID=A0ABP9KKZ8_9NOCA